MICHDGKLAASEVQRALTRHRHVVSDLRARLAALEQEMGKVGMLKDGPFPMKDGPFPMVSEVSRSKRRRNPKLSPATRKLYQQQGRYMAALRPHSKEARAKVRAIREKAGVRKAIAAAKRMAR